MAQDTDQTLHLRSRCEALEDMLTSIVYFAITCRIHNSRPWMDLVNDAAELLGDVDRVELTAGTDPQLKIIPGKRLFDPDRK